METKIFTIEDIQPGMVVELRNKILCLIDVKNRFFDITDGHWVTELCEYDGFDDKSIDEYDIMKVYKDYSLQEVLWERKETIDPDEICKQLIEKYGDKQIVVAIEELSELIKELCKTVRVEENKANITEEIADVLIMIRQMELLYGIFEEEVHDMILKKLARTKERLLDKK